MLTWKLKQMMIGSHVERASTGIGRSDGIVESRNEAVQE